MTRTTTLGAKGRRTRDRLVVAGFSLFIKEGVAHVSLDDILRFSDVKKGAFYYYFDSKDEFLQTCFEDCYLAPVGAVVDEFVAEGARSTADILRFFTQLTVRVREKMDALLGEHAVALEDVFSNIAYMSRQNDFMARHFVEFHAKQQGFVRDCLMGMQERGTIDVDVDCDEVARMMCSCREGIQTIAARNPQIDAGSELAIYMAYFDRLLGLT